MDTSKCLPTQDLNSNDLPEFAITGSATDPAILFCLFTVTHPTPTLEIEDIATVIQMEPVPFVLPIMPE